MKTSQSLRSDRPLRLSMPFLKALLACLIASAPITKAAADVPQEIYKLLVDSRSGVVVDSAVKLGATQSTEGPANITWPDLQDAALLQKGSVGWYFQSIPEDYWASWDEAPTRGVFSKLQIGIEAEVTIDQIQEVLVRFEEARWSWDDEEELQKRCITNSEGIVTRFEVTNLNWSNYTGIGLSPWHAEIVLTDGRKDQAIYYLPPPGEKLVITNPTYLYADPDEEAPDVADQISMLGPPTDCRGVVHGEAFRLEFAVNDDRAHWLNIWLYNESRDYLGRLSMSDIFDGENRAAGPLLNNGRGLLTDGTRNVVEFDRSDITWVGDTEGSYVASFRVCMYDGGQYAPRLNWDVRSVSQLTEFVAAGR